MRGKRDKQVAFLGVLVFLVLILLSKATGVGQFVNDSIIFIFLIVLFYIKYDKFNLSTPVYAFFVLSLIPHNLGIYGFYLNSPIGLQWDHFTHFMPIMAMSMIFFRALMPCMKKGKTFFFVLLALLAALGIGTFIEKAEFIGFSINGFGEGGFAFGAGDGCAGQVATTVEEIDAFGGGWFNTMYDLVWNFYGALVGVLLMFFTTKKERLK